MRPSQPQDSFSSLFFTRAFDLHRDEEDHQSLEKDSSHSTISAKPPPIVRNTPVCKPELVQQEPHHPDFELILHEPDNLEFRGNAVLTSVEPLDVDLIPATPHSEVFSNPTTVSQRAPSGFEGATNTVNRGKNHTPAELTHPQFSLSTAKPSDVAALVNVRANCGATPSGFGFHNNEAMFLSSVFSTMRAELKVCRENPTKNIMMKAVDRQTGLVIGYCLWGLAGLESRRLDDCAKNGVEVADGGDLDWLRKKSEVARGLEEATVPEGDCILLMYIAVLSQYQHQGVGSLLVESGIKKANIDERPVLAITSQMQKKFFGKFGFKDVERLSTYYALVRQPGNTDEPGDTDEPEGAENRPNSESIIKLNRSNAILRGKGRKAGDVRRSSKENSNEKTNRKSSRQLANHPYTSLTDSTS